MQYKSKSNGFRDIDFENGNFKILTACSFQTVRLGTKRLTCPYLTLLLSS